jgi:hypothetical protein
MAKQEGGADAKGHCIARPGMGLMCCGKRASKHLLSQKEHDIARGTDKLHRGRKSKGPVRIWKEYD